MSYQISKVASGTYTDPAQAPACGVAAFGSLQKHACTWVFVRFGLHIKDSITHRMQSTLQLLKVKQKNVAISRAILNASFLLKEGICPNKQ